MYRMRLIDADALLDKFEKESHAAEEHGRDFSFCFMRGDTPCAEWWTVMQMVEDAAISATNMKRIKYETIMETVTK